VSLVINKIGKAVLPYQELLMEALLDDKEPDEPAKEAEPSIPVQKSPSVLLMEHSIRTGRMQGAVRNKLCLCGSAYKFKRCCGKELT